MPSPKNSQNRLRRLTAQTRADLAARQAEAKDNQAAPYIDQGFDPATGKRRVKKVGADPISAARQITTGGIAKGEIVQVTKDECNNLFADKRPVFPGSQGSRSSSGTGVGGRSIRVRRGGSGGDQGPGQDPDKPSSEDAPPGTTPRYKRDSDGECYLIYTYAAGGGAPGFATLGECMDVQLTWYCEPGVLLGAECRAVTDGSGTYATREECLAAIDPGFTGGQCETAYNVTTKNQSVACDGSLGNLVPRNGSGQGPLRLIVYPKNPCNPALNLNGRAIVDATDKVVIFSNGQLDGLIKDVNISRIDGLPDDCGDPKPKCP